MEVHDRFFEVPEGEMVVGLRVDRSLNGASRFPIFIKTRVFDETSISLSFVNLSAGSQTRRRQNRFRAVAALSQASQHGITAALSRLTNTFTQSYRQFLSCVFLKIR